MIRTAIESYALQTDLRYAALTTALLFGIRAHRDYNPNIEIASEPSVSPYLHARLRRPAQSVPGEQPGADTVIMKPGGTPEYHNLRGADGMYVLEVDSTDYQGVRTTRRFRLNPDRAAVQVIFSRMKDFRHGWLHALAGYRPGWVPPAGMNDTTTVAFELTRLTEPNDVILASRSLREASGTDITELPGRVWDYPSHGGQLRIYESTVQNNPLPIAVGERFRLNLTADRDYPTDVDGFALAFVPLDNVNDVALMTAMRDAVGEPYNYEIQFHWATLRLDPRPCIVPEAEDASNNPDYGQPDDFTHLLPLPEFTHEILSVSVQGDGNLSGTYRAVGEGGWTPLNQGVTLPVTDPATGQTLRHAAEIRIRIEDHDARLRGVSVTIRQGQELDTATLSLPVLTSTPSADWVHADRSMRSVASGRVLARHPLMPTDLSGVRATDALGRDAPVQRRGELLCLSGDGPHVLYWSPEGGGVSPNVISEALYQLTHAPHPRGHWSGVEIRQDSRNVVTPQFQVHVGGVDYSSHVTEFTPDSVTLAGPSSAFETITNAVQEIRISGPTLPVFTGRAVRVDTRPHANGRVLTFRLLGHLDYFDVDLSRVNLQDDPLPVGEDDYIRRTLEHAGFKGRLLTAPDVQFRNLDFWQAALPLGPGLELSDVESRYRNSQNSSTLASVKQVLQASLLDIYELPDGDLYVDWLLPQVERTLPELLKSAPTVYCAAGGAYVNDPRINLSQISLALDENFSETEVEGFSNEVNLGIGKGLANFVQAYKQNNFLERTVGGYQSSATWTDNPFQVLENNALKHEFYPLEWFYQSHLPANGTAIESERIHQSGGFGGGGNKSITSQNLVILSPNEIVARWPQTADTIGDFVDQFLPSLDDPANPQYDTREKRMANGRLVAGIEISAGGDYVSKATFRIKVNVARPDAALMKVEPLEGKFDARWAPDWFPPHVAMDMVKMYRDLKPRNARKVSNPMIARIGSQYAVQKPNYRDGRITDNDYDTFWNTTASQLATWLTIKDLLKTRQVEVSLAGAQSITPNQFLFIARRPAGGPGTPYTQVDALLVLEPGRADARVGSEAWTRLRCAYVGTITNNEVSYDMPLGWGTVWESPL